MLPGVVDDAVVVLVAGTEDEDGAFDVLVVDITEELEVEDKAVVV